MKQSRKPVHKDRHERREDALRPNPFLGYDRDMLGLHLLTRQAYAIAETQFRRSVWLNPYEPRFKVHLAWCLYKQGKYDEARACLLELPTEKLGEDCQAVIRIIEEPVKARPSDGHVP